MNFKKFLKDKKTEELIEKVKENYKYGAILLVLIFVIWYANYSATREAEKEKEMAQLKAERKAQQQMVEHEELKGSKEDSFEERLVGLGSGSERRVFVNRKKEDLIFSLNDATPKKVLSKFFSSSPGDFYRIVFKAKTDNNELVRFKVGSDFGEEKQVGEMRLMGNEEERFYEVVFSVDGRYQDIVVEKDREKDERDWSGDKVYFSQFWLSRVDVKSKGQLSGLKPTFFGESKKAESLVDRYPFDKQRNNDFEYDDQGITQYFVANNDFMTHLEMSLKKMGSGGKGDYKIEIALYDEHRGKSKKVKSLYFSPQDLDSICREDGLCRFDSFVKLERGRTYLVELNNEKVKTDENNYLQLRNISGSFDWTAYFKVIFGDLPRFGNSREEMLIGSIIEDLGSDYSYSCSNSGAESDLFNVFEYQGDISFDRKSGSIVNQIREGNFLSYKINTGFPFEKLRVRGEAFSEDVDKTEIYVEYSFDNEKWEKIDYIESEDEVYEIDKTVINSKGNAKVVYLRLACHRGRNDKKYFGFKSLSVSGILKKYFELVAVPGEGNRENKD